MTQEVKEENQKYHTCEECGLFYTDKEMAEKCEAWCKEHHTCHLEIIKHAVNQNPDTA